MMRAVAAGGFAGAILRYLTALWIVPLPGGFPAGTLAANWTGCLALGWLLESASARFRLKPEWKAGLGTGLIGSYTTFSTFSAENIALLNEQRYGVFLVYLLLSIGVGFILTALGMKLAHYLGNRKEHKP